jgi:hypothetical protein
MFLVKAIRHALWMGKITAATESAVIAAYQSGRTRKQVSAECGVSPSTISKIFRRNRIVGRATRYELNESFFDDINSEESAYWAGFFSADGCMHQGHYQCSLYLAIRDKGHIEKFRAAVGYTGPLAYRSLKAPSGNVSDQCGVVIGRKVFYEGLLKQGIKPRKSWSLLPPNGNIPADLLRHYWRGHFDGDGSISKRSNRPGERLWQVSELGTKPMMEAFAEFVAERTGIVGRVHPKENVWKVLYGGIQHPQTVAHLLYDSATVYLDRKKERVDALFATVAHKTRGIIVGGRYELTAAIASRLGIAPGTIRQRIKNRGMSLEAAATTVKHDIKRLTYNGVTLSISDWANRLSINPFVIRERLRKNESIEMVLRPTLEVQTLTVNGVTATIPQWAAQSNITASTIYRRLKAGDTPEDAIRPTAACYHRSRL